MKCEICASSNLYEILDLGHQPPSDAFLSEEKLNEAEVFYPLKVFFCEDCKLIQLSYAVDPKLLFTDNYIYTSTSNKPLLVHMRSLAERFVKEFNLNKENLVIDIASNDGALLKEFSKHEVRILGVDPSSVADIAIKEKVPTIKDFFNEDLANKILLNYGKAKLITGLSLIPHAKELTSIINGIKLLLEEEGVFLAESHYVVDMIEKLQYDAIYHEHLRYYSVTSLVNLFDRFGMDVFHAERIQTHGGSIRVLVCKKGAYPVMDSVRFLLEAEKRSGLNTHENFNNFRNKVNENKIKLNAILHEIKSKGHKIVGIGAPAKGTTLLNFCKIDSSKVDYLLETTELKIGKYSPGMHIKIVPESKLFEEKPEYALLLPWNIKDDIIPKLRAKGYEGYIIIPNPEPKVIDPRVITIKPAFEDARGKIMDIVDGIDFVHAGIVTYSPGAIRGNHYHKQTEQLNYVLKGRIKHLSKDLSKKGSEVKEVILEAGDMINNPPYEWHSDEGLEEENELLFFTKKARGEGGYEEDVYRISKEDIENFELG